MYALLAKVIGVGVIIVALIGIGEWHGRQDVQERWDAAIAVQAVAAAESVIQAAENTARVEQAFAQTLAEHDANVKTVEREVKVYVQGKSKKCPVSPDLEHAVDSISVLLDAPSDRMPASARSTGAVTEPPEASTPAAEIVPAVPVVPLTDDVLLLAYEHAVTELDELWIVYAALVEWTRTNYTLQVEAAGR